MVCLHRLTTAAVSPYHQTVVPSTYARLTRLALWALAAIVVTGAAVRLTGSGLGCEDWPTCTEDSLVADLEYHALVEFVNRLFTGVVAAAVIAAVLGSWRRRPRRHDLIMLSCGLVVGVLAQVVLGALLVKTELDPRFTMGHFLLSMVLLWNAAVLDSRARRQPDGTTGDGGERRRRRGDRRLDARSRLMRWAVLAAGGVLIVTGTLVTGAGPHAGDTRAERLPLLVREVARVHSIVAMAVLALVLLTWRRLRSVGAGENARMGRVAGLMAVQGAVGYAQYFAGVPALLVGVHVALATVTWIEIVKAVHAPVATAPAAAAIPQPATASTVAASV